MSTPRDLDRLQPGIEAAGFTLVAAHAGTMDSGIAEFSDGRSTVKIVRDRSQWMLSGERPQLEPFDLWRAYESTEEFREALVHYLRTSKAQPGDAGDREQPRDPR